MIGKAIYSLIIDTENGVGDTIGTRCFPMTAPQGSEYPLVTYEPSPPQPSDTKHGPSTLDVQPAEVVIYSRRFSEAEEIASTLRAMFDRYSGTVATVAIQSVQFQNQSYEHYPEIELYAIVQQYQFRLPRDLSVVITGSPLEELNLGRLADVDTTGATDDQVLTYDAATNSWGPEDASTVAALDDLTDVTINDPIDRQTLAYDEATGQWINDGAGSISIPIFNNLNEEIVAGRPLSAIGAQGDRISVEPYQTAYGALRFVGIAGETIAARSNGHATVYGEIRGLDTSNFPVGTLLYPLEGVNENFYPFGLFSWVEGTNANPLVCAIVTRQQQNTGRIFVRMWSPGYRNNLNRMDDVVISNPFQGALLRYDSDQGDWRVPPQTSKTILEAATETVEIYYYSITTDTQQFRSAQSDTPSSGNKIVRKIWYSTTAQEDIDSGTWTLLETLADNATYADLVDAFEDQLKTSPGGDTPISIKTTWAEVEEFDGLLDTYTGAAAAYSLRRLAGTYTGSAIRVRRASDDAEQDIGFDENGDLDTTALATFCSGTNGFVKVWYCQSGNGNDATQTTTSAQPKIYDSASGVLLINSNKPALSFNGSSRFNLSSTLSSSNQNFFYVTDTTTDLGVYLLADESNYVRNQVTRYLLYNGSSFYSANISVSSGYSVHSVVNNLGAYQNGSKLADFSNSFTINYNQILRSYSARYYQELIIYPSDQSSNRTGIETNINDYFGIYTPFTTGLLDDYSGAAAAYSLRRLSSPYTGPAIRVRRASDNAEQDIGFDIEGNLNTGALAGFCSGTNGFVKTWYDQSGNGNDATQTTTGKQPKIYDASTGVELENGKPAFDFNGSSHQLVASVTISSAAASTSFVVVNPDIVTLNRRMYNMHDGAAGDERNSTFFNSQFNIYDGTNGLSTGTAVAGTQYVITSRFVTGDGTIHANGTLQGTSAAIAQKSVNTLSIGKQDVGAAFYFNGKMQEFTLYASDQSTNRTGIETNINDYYSIYTP